MNIISEFCIFQLVQVSSLSLNWQFWFLSKKSISHWNKKSEHHYWSRHNQISVGTKFHLDQIFQKNGILGQKRKKVIKTTEFSISELVYNISHKWWDQPPWSLYQCILQVSETVSWHQLRRCYSSNMLQHWIGGGAWIISFFLFKFLFSFLSNLQTQLLNSKILKFFTTNKN